MVVAACPPPPPHPVLSAPYKRGFAPASPVSSHPPVGILSCAPRTKIVPPFRPYNRHVRQRGARGGVSLVQASVPWSHPGKLRIRCKSVSVPNTHGGHLKPVLPQSAVPVKHRKGRAALMQVSPSTPPSLTHDPRSLPPSRRRIFELHGTTIMAKVLISLLVLAVALAPVSGNGGSMG